MVGIGENTHIAFNDPPADFDDESAYKIVELNKTCRIQQVREGWFSSIDDVFSHAITMTCRQIMKCDIILSVVPYKVKAKAIELTLKSEKTNLVPATVLKEHKDCTVFCDKYSVSMVGKDLLEKYLEK